MPATPTKIRAEFPEKLQFLFQPARYKVCYGGRGRGASWGFARALLIQGAQRKLRSLCTREYQTSVADSVHQLLGDQIQALGLNDFYQVQERKILGRNGSKIKFFGLRKQFHHIASYEGIDRVWMEEGNSTSRASWRKLDPTIRKDGSEIWVTFNPELEEDFMYDLMIKHPPPGAAVVKMTWRDNPWFPPVLEQQRQDLKVRDEDEYLHVWEGHCRQSLDGAIYAKEIREATLEERVTKVPYDRSRPVDTIWDLGRSDKTSIWFRQRVGMHWHYIDFHEDDGHDISHYIHVLQSRGYVLGTHFLPHDGKAKTIGSKLSVEEQMKAAFGARQVKIVPALSHTDRINAGRTIFTRCYFDAAACADGLNHLRKYCYAVNEKTGQHSKEPKHDVHSHAGNAFDYSGVASKEPTEKPALDGLKTPRRPRLNLARPGVGWMG